MAYYKKKLWRIPDEHGVFPELKQKQIEKLEQRSLNYCIWALGQAPKTEAELRKKMKEKNCPDDIADKTIEKLKRYEYINDRQVAELYISSKISAKWGNRRIRQELLRKGISEELADELLAPDSVDDPEESEEYQRAYDFAQKKVNAMPHSLDDKKKTNRLVGAMVRRGFPMDFAFQMSDKLIRKTDD